MQEYRPDALVAAITQSRLSFPRAVDALCETIAEVSGRAPDRRVVEHVGRLWLMHVCDQMVHEKGYQVASSIATETPTRIVVPLRSLLTATEIGARAAVTRRLQTLQYATELQSDRLTTAILTNRKVSRRDTVLSRFGSSSAPIAITAPYLKVSGGSELRAAWRARRELHWDTDRQPQLPTSTVNEAARKSVAIAALQSDDTDRFMRALIAITAPLDLVENFWALHSWAAKQDFTPKLWYTATAQHTSTAFMHRMAIARERGGRLLVHQHGGGYGIDEQHLGEDHDIAVSDRFYTFGWSRADQPSRVAPLPTAMAQRFQGTPQGILLMSLPVTTGMYRLQPFCLPSHIERAVTLTSNFVFKLAATTKITLRHSGHDRFPMERLANARTTIDEDAGLTPGSVAASRAALVVHNYLGTSWLETLAMNVPTVCFYDPEFYRPRAEARPFLDALVRVGVLHYSGSEAAKFVNSLRGNPAAWWQSAEVQEAREAFVARYANFSDNWLEAWTEEFERLLS
jgi:putative transferase (TIGR04331 family)